MKQTLRLKFLLIAFTLISMRSFAQTPCLGAPNAGNAFALNSNPCLGSIDTLMLINSSNSSGLTYQWQQSSTGIAGTWLNITGATSSVYVYNANFSGTQYYQCIVTCNNGTVTSSTSTSVSVTTQTYSASWPCYCIPNYASIDTSCYISNVTLGILNNNSAYTNVSPSWQNFTGAQIAGTVPIPIVGLGSTFNVSVKQGSSPNNYCAIWIDMNHNNQFEPSEYFSNGSNAGANGTHIISCSMSSIGFSGLTRMRVRGGDTVQMIATQGCNTTNSSFGEAEDYLINFTTNIVSDPGVSSITLPNGNCFNNSETVLVDVYNFGPNSLPLNATNYLIVHLNVDGPNGLTVYNDTLNVGNIASNLSGTPIVATFNIAGGNAIDFSAIGTYNINTSIDVIGMTNLNLSNDSLPTASSLTNLAVPPIAGPTFHLCQNDTIAFGQGLTLSGYCSITDSVILNFNVTGCVDNVGAFQTGTTQGPNNANCANIYAGNFASVLKPSLPSNATFPVPAKLSIANLSSTGNQTEVRFNLFGSNNPSLPATYWPLNPSIIYSYIPQGYNLNAGNINIAGQSMGVASNFTNTRNISVNDLANLFVDTSTNPYLHIGYWETWNDLINSADATINAGGNPTVATLKIIYQYNPSPMNWYETNTTNTVLSNNNPFNPFLVPNTVVNNSNVTGDFIFWGACANSPSCRVADTLRIHPLPIANVASLFKCADSIGMNNVNFNLLSLDTIILGGSTTSNTVTYFQDSSLTSLINFPSSYSSVSDTIYAQVINPQTGCDIISPVYLTVGTVDSKIVNQITQTGNEITDCLNTIPSGNISLIDGAIKTLSTSLNCRRIAQIEDVANGISLGLINIQESINCNPTLNWNGQPYLNRTFDISPSTNDTSKVCLFVLNDDFVKYNTNNPTWPQLPTASTPANIANLAVTRLTPGINAISIPQNNISATYDPTTTVWSICFLTPLLGSFYIHSLNFNNVPLPIKSSPSINKTNINIFPNPVSRTLNVEIITLQNSKAKIKIMDATGKNISHSKMDLKIGLNKSEIDMQNFSSGIYLIQITNDKDVNYTQTFRKN